MECFFLILFVISVILVYLFRDRLPKVDPRLESEILSTLGSLVFIEFFLDILDGDIKEDF